MEYTTYPKVAVFCIGNRLHMDDGVGGAVHDAVIERFDVPEGVELLDLGVLTMDRIDYVDQCDAIITVDAVEYSGQPVGTVLRGTPEDLARSLGAAISMHDLRLADLFDAAILLDYHAEGVCLGIQVANTQPEILTDELSPEVAAAIPLLVETLAAELCRLGYPLIEKSTGKPYLGPQNN